MNDNEDDLDNIFAEYEAEDRVDDPNQDETPAELALPHGKKVLAPKRVVKNPRLKFDPDRLCGERGIPILVDHFKKVKFKGKGHEAENLNKLLAALEHWTHRLFPSMKFEDTLQHIEKLGRKRPVKTCLQKIRMDMPVLHSKDATDEETDVIRNFDSVLEVVDQDDAFDRLVEQSRMYMGAASSSQNETSRDADPFTALSTPGHVLGTIMETSITEEQRQRMEYNRLLAIERRKSKLSASQSSYTEPQDSESLLNDEEAPCSSTSLEPQASVSTLSNSFDHFCEDGETSHSQSNAGTINEENSEQVDLDDMLDILDTDCNDSQQNVVNNFADTDIISENREYDESCIF